MKKGQLPTKICPICNKPFEWRKKWVRDWATVIYCSERCQREAKRLRNSCPFPQSATLPLPLARHVPANGVEQDADADK